LTGVIAETNNSNSLFSAASQISAAVRDLRRLGLESQKESSRKFRKILGWLFRFRKKQDPSRADWWTESQSGSGATATLDVSDGTNFTFVPYFDFVKIRTRTVLQISDDPAKSARITCIYHPSS
jgi:hypothetical protein